MSGRGGGAVGFCVLAPGSGGAGGGGGFCDRLGEAVDEDRERAAIVVGGQRRHVRREPGGRLLERGRAAPCGLDDGDQQEGRAGILLPSIELVAQRLQGSELTEVLDEALVVLDPLPGVLLAAQPLEMLRGGVREEKPEVGPEGLQAEMIGRGVAPAADVLRRGYHDEVLVGLLEPVPEAPDVQVGLRGQRQELPPVRIGDSGDRVDD